MKICLYCRDKKPKGQFAVFTNVCKPCTNAGSAMHRAAKLGAAPGWLSDLQKEEIRQLYSLAHELNWQTGMTHHVDHIVPLNGKGVCGLHVPWNLRVITASSNISKGNRMADYA